MAEGEVAEEVAGAVARVTCASVTRCAHRAASLLVASVVVTVAASVVGIAGAAVSRAVAADKCDLDEAVGVT